MTVVPVRRRATRAVALLASGFMAVGLAQAPSMAAADDTSNAELRSYIRTFDADIDSAFAADAAGEARRVDVVRDTRGDGASVQLARGGRPYTRLADLTEVRYKTPSRIGGDLRITTSWNYLADARSPGARRQTLVSFFEVRNQSRGWYVVSRNDGSRVSVIAYDDATGEFRRIRPEKVRIRRDYGRDGSTDLILSSEMLDGRRLVFGTYAIAGAPEAYDEIRPSKVLDAGPLR